MGGFSHCDTWDKSQGISVKYALEEIPGARFCAVSEPPSHLESGVLRAKDGGCYRVEHTKKEQYPLSIKSGQFPENTASLVGVV